MSKRPKTQGARSSAASRTSLPYFQGLEKSQQPAMQPNPVHSSASFRRIQPGSFRPSPLNPDKTRASSSSHLKRSGSMMLALPAVPAAASSNSALMLSRNSSKAKSLNQHSSFKEHHEEIKNRRRVLTQRANQLVNEITPLCSSQNPAAADLFLKKIFLLMGVFKQRVLYSSRDEILTSHNLMEPLTVKFQKLMLEGKIKKRQLTELRKTFPQCFVPAPLREDSKEASQPILRSTSNSTVATQPMEEDDSSTQSAADKLLEELE